MSDGRDRNGDLRGTLFNVLTTGFWSGFWADFGSLPSISSCFFTLRPTPGMLGPGSMGSGGPMGRWCDGRGTQCGTRRGGDARRETRRDGDGGRGEWDGGGGRRRRKVSVGQTRTSGACHALGLAELGLPSTFPGPSHFTALRVPFISSSSPSSCHQNRSACVPEHTASLQRWEQRRPCPIAPHPRRDGHDLRSPDPARTPTPGQLSVCAPSDGSRMQPRRLSPSPISYPERTHRAEARHAPLLPHLPCQPISRSSHLRDCRQPSSQARVGIDIPGPEPGRGCICTPLLALEL